jgi:hypothetical protein
MVPSNGQNEPTSSDEKGRSTAEIGRFLAFREIRSMIRVWGSASIVLRCPAIALCPLHSLLLSLSLFVASGRCDCLRAFFVFIMTAYTEADLAAELEQSKLNVSSLFFFFFESLVRILVVFLF